MSAGSIAKAVDRYEAARQRAMSRGFICVPVEELIGEATLDEILERLKHIDNKSPLAVADGEAMSGSVQPVSVKITEAFAAYCNKSEPQVSKKVHRTATHDPAMLRSDQRPLSSEIRVS
ncbi:hypothetical protein [uncultured Algimonas sp.]|uniref:hypothetical protein n=1 Tax=uncultured Algimonas sp. TaxID=1547920 RepID=UPI002608A6F8|nr:hypothetical protein [uncultured Algimonas sp.]